MQAVFVVRKGRTLLLAVGGVLVTLALVTFPEEGLQAAKDGLKVFWEIVLPSLFPFFVLSELLLGLGVVHCLGVILEPIMRPFFNVPGVGAFALSMGLAAGYPMDAVITAKFRRSGLCTRTEGERLLAFTNTADPLFMFGAVAVGMFGNVRLGALIATAHYLSAFSVGFLFRFYGERKLGQDRSISEASPREGVFKRALYALYKARQEDGRPVGQLLADAVKESMATIFMIGGFIMLFAVLVRILTAIGVMALITPVVSGLLRLFGLDPGLAGSLLQGLLEIDLGCMAVARTTAPLSHKMILVSSIIAWSGLSVHGQVASVVHGTDIRLLPYLVARVLHALLAGLYTLLLLKPMAIVTGALPLAITYTPLGGLRRVVLTGRQLAVIVGSLLLLAGFNYLRQKFVLVKERGGCLCSRPSETAKGENR